MVFKFQRPEDSPGFLLWQLTNEWQRKQRQALKKLSLTHPQFVVLAALLWLSGQQKQITQQQVSDLTKIDKMSMSDLVMTLTRKKLLLRKVHPEDARAYVLQLTAAGKQLVSKAVPIVEGIDLEFFTPKTENLTHLMRVLSFS